MDPARPLAPEEALYTAHRRVVFDYALRRLGNVVDAENVVQEAFARTFAAMRTTDVAFPRAYLLRTAANLATDLDRLRAREVGDPPDLAGPAPSPETDRQRVRDAVARLPDKQRVVVTLRYTEGLSFRGIGERLGLSRNAAHHRHQTAMEALRRLLGIR